MALGSSRCCDGFFFWTTPAAAQWFRLGTWEGSLEGQTEWDRQDFRTGATERSRFERLHSDERLTLQNTGMYIYDPRLVSLTLGGTFGFSQDRITTTDTDQDSNATLSGYTAFVSLLPEQTLSLNVFANRNESVLSREFAGRSEVVVENRGGTLFLRQLAIPSTVTARQELLEETSTTANVIARRAEHRNIVRYEGQRGWVDRELNLAYEFVDDADEVFPGLSYQSHEGEFNWSMDFGEELNRHWDSRARYLTRTGLVPSTIWSVDESLRIDHTERLTSNYRYYLVQNDSRSALVTTHTGTASLQHRLWESLTTTAGADGVHQTLTAGETDTARGRLEIGYTKRLPLGGRLNVGLGGGLQFEDDRFKTTESAVSQETHTATTPIALPIRLANRLVVTSSIVVTKTAAGPRPAVCGPPPPLPTPLTEGVDFTIRTTGDITEIVPIPCAVGVPGINPGDTIAVDYRFRVGPSRRFTTQNWHGTAGVDYRWVRVFVTHEESEQSLLSGADDGFLDNVRSDSVGAELRYDHPRLRASLLGEARRFVSRRNRYDSLRSSALAAATLFADLTLTLSGDRVVTTFPDEQRETRTLSGRAALEWSFGTALSVEASGGVQRIEDTLQPAQQSSDARLLVRWMVRKLEIGPSVEYFNRRHGDTTSTEYRVLLRTIRRF